MSCYAMVGFFIFSFEAPRVSGGTNPPVADWVGFSAIWRVFYSPAFAILCLATVAPKPNADPPPSLKS